VRSSQTSLEVDAAVSEVPSWLHVVSKAEGACGLDHGAVYEPLVSGVIDLSESVVVGARDTKGREESNASEAEEIGHIHERQGVEGRSSKEVLGVAH